MAEENKIYSVYALVKNGGCVYVGCSSYLKQRLYNHLSLKDYDSHIVISDHSTRKEALLAERSIIKFLSIFGGNSVINGKYVNLKDRGEYEHGIDTRKNNY